MEISRKLVLGILILFVSTVVIGQGTRITDLFINITTINATTINVRGNVTADFFIGNGTIGTIAGFTQTQYRGNITNGSAYGYTAANQICNNDIPGSHFCYEVEILNTIRLNRTYTGTYWMIKGAPGYTAEANDCSGFTTNSTTSLGAFWNWDSDGDAGQGKLTNCGQLKNLTCCK